MMSIGGFQSLSLSDFPDVVSSIVFLQGCNFRCPYCHNSELIPRPSICFKDNIDSFFSTIENMRQKIDGIVVCGGEPTIFSELPIFVQKIKSLGFLVKIDTNGSHPEILEVLINDGIVDFIAMDVKAPWNKYGRLCGIKNPPINAIKRSMKLISSSGISHQFRTTVVPPMLSEKDVDDIKAMIPKGSPYKLQKFEPENATMMLSKI